MDCHVPSMVVVSHSLIPSHSVVEDGAEKDHYWRSLLHDWGVKRAKTFPGCNPMSLSRDTLSVVRRHPYSITLKSDGVRYVLYCTTRPGSTASSPLPIALMIDRCRNMYEIDVVATEDVFVRRTILEGELVWKQPEERQMLFLVFDCVMDKGVSMTERTFTERHSAALGLVRLSEELSTYEQVEQQVDETGCIVVMQYDPCVRMRGKNFVAREFANRLWNERQDTEHRVDGIILQREDAPYTFGTATNHSVLKWKARSTVDLMGKSSLHTSDGVVPRHLLGRKVTMLSGSRIQAKNEQDVLEYLLTVTVDEVQLFAVRKRVDKAHANSNFVFLATVQDVIDDITILEITSSE